MSREEDEPKSPVRSYRGKSLVARLLPETSSVDQVKLLRVVIQDKFSSLEEADLKPCGHAEIAAKIFQKARPAVLQAAQRKCRCDLCDSDSDIWLCLTCLGMFCGREGEGHGLQHFKDTGHCVILSLMSLNFWCYAHEQYLEHDFYPSLLPIFKAIHEVKHGEPARYAVSSPENSMFASADNCTHVESAVNKQLPSEISLEMPCLECGDKTEVWICLSCFEAHCGRYVKKHMIQHNSEKPGHVICLNLNDLSIWCQKCQQYLDTFKHPYLTNIFNSFHKLKFKDEDLPESILKFRTAGDDWMDELDFSLIDSETL